MTLIQSCQHLPCITCNTAAHLNGCGGGHKTVVQHSQGPSSFSALVQATPLPSHHTPSRLLPSLQLPLYCLPSLQQFGFPHSGIACGAFSRGHNRGYLTLQLLLTFLLTLQLSFQDRNFHLADRKWPQSPELLHSQSHREGCPQLAKFHAQVCPSGTSYFPGMDTVPQHYPAEQQHSGG